jgi:hypothetical protein
MERVRCNDFFEFLETIFVDEKKDSELARFLLYILRNVLNIKDLRRAAGRAAVSR